MLDGTTGRRGTQVVVPYRGTDDDRRHLKLMGDLGQIVHLVCFFESVQGSSHPILLTND
jgi:hypothetical protein